MAHPGPPRPSTTELDLGRDLALLLQIAERGETVDDLLRRGLDWLARVAPYDLATVFELDGDELRVRAARGKLAERVREHRIRLADFPGVREAIESRRARAFTEDDHAHGDGDPFDGVLDLTPGHSCMVVPLTAGDSVLGLLSLDRAECGSYPPEVVDLVEVYGRLLALAFRGAQQSSALHRVHERDRERRLLEEADRLGDAHRLLEGSRSPRMRELVRRAAQVARTDTPVLLLGETGTGKERLARAIHAWSARAEGPFVAINCAAVPAGLLESELFGHVRGAFTGAIRERAGRFQLAHGGTLLLDEVGDLPVELQVKLLRVLQESRFEPVGSDRSVRVDVRVVAATHVDLQRAISERRFREDLYYRLSVFPLHLLPLRERLEDLPLACEVLLAELSARTGRRFRVSEEGLQHLVKHRFPGNLRELANLLERACIVSDSPVLRPEALELAPLGADDGAPPAGRFPTLDEALREHVRRALALTRGKIYGADGAAALLGLRPSTLQSKMSKLGIARGRE